MSKEYTKRMIDVMQAFIDGATIECVETDRLSVWQETHYPSWNWSSCDYRVKELVQDSIDWSHVAPEYKFMARDCDGECTLFRTEPSCVTDYNRWQSYDEGVLVSASGFSSYKRGTVAWVDSLVRRTG